MTPELVIFDCDGVLVDSEPIANGILVQMLQELGIGIDVDESSRRFVGRSIVDCLKIIEQLIGRPVPQGFVERYDERTFDAFRRELEPVEGVPELLDLLTMPICVASSGSHEKMRTTLGTTGLLPRFESHMFSATEVARGKPHPDLFRMAAARMAAHVQRVAVVEDAPVGVQAAVRAGMRVFGYAPHDDGGELAQAGAHVFHRMHELVALLEQ